MSLFNQSIYLFILFLFILFSFSGMFSVPSESPVY